MTDAQDWSTQPPAVRDKHLDDFFANMRPAGVDFAGPRTAVQPAPVEVSWDTPPVTPEKQSRLRRVAFEVYCQGCRETVSTGSVLAIAGAPFTLTIPAEHTRHLLISMAGESSVSVYLSATVEPEA